MVNQINDVLSQVIQVIIGVRGKFDAAKKEKTRPEPSQYVFWED